MGIFESVPTEQQKRDLHQIWPDPDERSRSDEVRSRLQRPKSPAQKLSEHTPSPEYTTAAMRRRALELIGAKGELLNTLAPMPYKSEYPFSPKIMDAALTMTLDPIVKPLSLQKGQLDRIPILKKLSKELADRGFFQKYPAGGIGIGGGGGSPGGDDAGPGPGPGAGVTQPGPEPPDATPDPSTGSRGSSKGDSDVTNVGETGELGNPANTGFNASAAGRGAVGGGWGSFMSAAASAIAALAGIGGFGLGGAGIGLGINAAMGEIGNLSSKTGASTSDSMAALASARGATGVGGPQGGGAQGSPGGGDPGSDASSPTALSSAPASIGAKNVSPSTRANAAARIGGGIAPDFLQVLQSLQG